MSDTVESIRRNYDSVADEYARRIFDELRNKPLDRQLLDRFVAATRERGEVCDMGCGPGHVARYLRDAGAAASGLDLSPGMLEQARQLNPGMEFRQGNMLALDMKEDSLAGITAFYAIVNLPPEVLPTVFREMHRVLRPDGLLLLAFHNGDEERHLTEFLDRPVDMSFHLFDPRVLGRVLESIGFKVEEIIERDAYPEVEHPTRRAYIFARKPASSQAS